MTEVNRDVPLTFDPNKLLSPVIDFLYTNTIDINSQNLANLAVIAQFYRFASLSYALKDLVPQGITFETSLPILHDFISFDLGSCFGLVIQFFAANFLKFSREDRLRSVSPQALSQILADGMLQSFSTNALVADLSTLETQYPRLGCTTLAWTLPDEDRALTIFRPAHRLSADGALHCCVILFIFVHVSDAGFKGSRPSHHSVSGPPARTPIIPPAVRTNSRTKR
jgi:hypothetical protein